MIRRLLLHWLIAVAGSPALRAQDDDDRPNPGSYRNAAEVLEVFQTLADRARPAMALVLDGDRPKGHATVVDAAGLLIAKASELPERPLCRLGSGDEVPAEVLARDLHFDLALLRIDPVEGLESMPWSAQPVHCGRMLVAVTPAGEVVALGVVGVIPKTIKGEHARLGIVLQFGVEPAVISRVHVDTPAAVAGLQEGDRILQINGRTVEDRRRAIDLIRESRAGDEVTLILDRAGEEIEIAPVLSARNVGSGRTDRFEGEQSGLRAGFPSALQHDIVLRPDQCGGPILGLDGRAVGINIARAGRVATYAIPAVEVAQIVARLKESAGIRATPRARR